MDNKRNRQMALPGIDLIAGLLHLASGAVEDGKRKPAAKRVSFVQIPHT
jgi:hypothetical protein